jgi:hypothetical protein
VADFLLVKKTTNEFGDIVLDYNNAITLETKLNESTALSTNQGHGLTKVKSANNVFDVRSSSREGLFNIENLMGTNTDNKTITVKDFIKVWSEGEGKSILDIKSLK